MSMSNIYGINYEKLPAEGLRDGLKLYIEQGYEPGSFLMAVLENNLAESFARADNINRYLMFEIVSWLYNEVPMACWGSKERVKAWMEEKKADRLAKKEES